MTLRRHERVDRIEFKVDETNMKQVLEICFQPLNSFRGVKPKELAEAMVACATATRKAQRAATRRLLRIVWKAETDFPAAVEVNDGNFPDVTLRTIEGLIRLNESIGWEVVFRRPSQHVARIVIKAAKKNRLKRSVYVFAPEDILW